MAPQYERDCVSDGGAAAFPTIAGTTAWQDLGPVPIPDVQKRRLVG